MSRPTKIPFDFSLFFGAVVHLAGKEPDRFVRHGDSGFYDFIWILAKKDMREIRLDAIIRWMNYFDIEAGSSRCDIACWTDIPESRANHEPVLRITIKHPVRKEEEISQ